MSDEKKGRGRPPTDKSKIDRMLFAGFKQHEIVKRLGVSPNTVSRRRKELGVTGVGGRNVPKEEILLLCAQVRSRYKNKSAPGIIRAVEIVEGWLS